MCVREREIETGTERDTHTRTEIDRQTDRLRERGGRGEMEGNNSLT